MHAIAAIPPDLASEVRLAAGVATRAAAVPLSEDSHLREIGKDILTAHTAHDVVDIIGDYMTRVEEWFGAPPLRVLPRSSNQDSAEVLGPFAERLERAFERAAWVARGSSFATSSALSPAEIGAMLYDQRIPPSVRLAMSELVAGVLAVAAVQLALEDGEPIVEPVAAQLTAYVEASVEATAKLNELLG